VDLGRLRVSDWIVGALGACVVGVMFLDWYEGVRGWAAYGAVPPEPAGGATINAWQAFAVTDVVMAVAAGMAIALVPIAATQQTAALPVAWSALTALVSGFAAVWTFVRVLSVPEPGLVRSTGPTLGLATMLLLAIASWSAVRNERPGDAIAQQPLEIETLPAPR
jgi:uncharacterized membrane protein